jgi:hypothetical protein
MESFGMSNPSKGNDKDKKSRSSVRQKQDMYQASACVVRSRAVEVGYIQQ